MQPASAESAQHRQDNASEKPVFFQKRGQFFLTIPAGW